MACRAGASPGRGERRMRRPEGVVSRMGAVGHCPKVAVVALLEDIVVVVSDVAGKCDHIPILYVLLNDCGGPG